MSPHPPARDDRSILQMRALALARRPERPRDQPALELLAFRVAGEAYAVETRWLAEVVRLRDLTPVPCAPSFIAGIVNFRGVVLAALDLQRFLEAPSSGLADLDHLVVVRGGGIVVGILAQDVLGVQRQALDGLYPAPPGLGTQLAQHARGITGQRIVVLDVERILADPRLGSNDSSPVATQNEEGKRGA